MDEAAASLIRLALSSPRRPLLASLTRPVRTSRSISLIFAGTAHSLRTARELRQNMSGKTDSYSGKTWSMTATALRFRSEHMSLKDSLRRVRLLKLTMSSSARRVDSKSPNLMASAMRKLSTESVFVGLMRKFLKPSV